MTRGRVPHNVSASTRDATLSPRRRLFVIAYLAVGQPTYLNATQAAIRAGYPFPVDRSTYDRSIGVLTEAVRRARIGQTDKIEALKRIAGLAPPNGRPQE